MRSWGWQGRLAIGALGINQDPNGVLLYDFLIITSTFIND